MAPLKMHTDETQAPGQGEARATENEAPQLFSDSRSRRKKQDMGPDYGYQRMRMHKSDEVNFYADAQDERHAMDPRKRSIIVMLIVMVVVFFFSCTLPTNVFDPAYRADNSISTLLSEFSAQVGGFFVFLSGGDTLYAMQLWEVVAALLAGAALAVSGGVYQGALKNALASPSTLGVTSGGTLGMLIYVFFFYSGSSEYSGSLSSYSDMLSQMSPTEYIFEMYGTFICSLIGCFVIVALIMVIAFIAGRGHVSNASLIIAGQAFAAVISVVLTWMRYFLEETGDAATGQLLTSMQTLSFNGVYSLQSVLVFGIPLIICMGVIFAVSPRLSLLAFNDEEARSMGISVAKTRNLMVALCTILTALVISFVGPIGFVGFMVPHVARRFVGADFRFLLPASAVLGAILVVGVHYISSMGIPYLDTGSTGLFTSIVGCVMFLWMALQRRGDRRAEWF